MPKTANANQAGQGGLLAGDTRSPHRCSHAGLAAVIVDLPHCRAQFSIPRLLALVSTSARFGSGSNPSFRRTHSAASSSSFRSGSRPRSGHPSSFHTPINSRPPPRSTLQSAPESPDHNAYPIDSKPDPNTLTKSCSRVIGRCLASTILPVHNHLRLFFDTLHLPYPIDSKPDPTTLRRSLHTRSGFPPGNLKLL